MSNLHSKSSDLVSIITPAYRCGGVVGETIQSVLDQTYPHWEMLIVEDCSPPTPDPQMARRNWQAASISSVLQHPADRVAREVPASGRHTELL